DARSMATTARMPRIVGYNVQTAVEADNHLIVAHEVTMFGFDRDALSMMAVAAQDEMTTDQLTEIADKGYYKGEEIVASEDAGISVVVPKPMTSNAAARGQFDKADFAYDRDMDGPVALLCRPKCSFRAPIARRRQGFSSPVLSGDGANCRSR
ncbi:MAG: hypothetical protein WBB85_09810, partial [Albidovulum sp.]